MTADERKGLERYDEFNTTGNAYARFHGTKPATIGLVLSASPVALLAWCALRNSNIPCPSTPADRDSLCAGSARSFSCGATRTRPSTRSSTTLRYTG